MLQKIVLTICNIKPLLLLPVLFMIFELKVNVWFPGNIRVINCNISRLVKILVRRELVCVSENTLCNQTTWYSDIVLIKFCFSIKSNCFANISVSNDWITTSCSLSKCYWVTHKLSVWSRLYVSSMVLVEIVKFVIDIDWCRNSGSESNFLNAIFA